MDTKCHEILVIVPLRLQSSRLPQKILEDVGGKILAVRVLERVRECFKGASSVKIVAAVDSEITAKHLSKTCPWLKVVMTSPDLKSGTDRVYQAVQSLRSEYPEMNQLLKGIINVQGDMPYVGAHILREMASFILTENKDSFDCITASHSWSDDIDYANPAHVKVLSSRSGEAIYFSRFPIPFSRNSYETGKPRADFHVGIYAYSLPAITKFCLQTPNWMEEAEGLEQLRALYLGLKIKVFKTKIEKDVSFRGVDTPEDLAWARSISKTNT